MAYQIDITLSNYFTDSDLDDFNRLKISNYSFITSRRPKDTLLTGGLIWNGIVFFITENLAEGFLNAIGQLGFEWIKDLFQKKKRLKPHNIERFTFNIPFNNGMLFFDFTNISTEEDFSKAIKSAKKAYDDNIEQLKKEAGFMISLMMLLIRNGL